MQQELKNMVFKAIEDHLSLNQFEEWLYNQEELANQMNDDLILALFTFNYNQKGAKYEFKSFLDYLEKEEFMIWKIKTNLQDLIDGRETRDRILNDFYCMGYDKIPCIQGLGYYMYELEDAEYLAIGKESVIQNLKREASELLQEILEEERRNPDLKISTFKRQPRMEFRSQITNTVTKSKEWWEFWK